MNKRKHITRSEYWERWYQDNPYLQNARYEELCTYFGNVTYNMTPLNNEGKISIGYLDDTPIKWLEKWAYACIELQNRGLFYPKWNDEWGQSNLDSKRITEAIRLAKRLNFPKTSYLLKFGEADYMKAALEEGNIRVCGATYYNDPSLNNAMRDDERVYSLFYTGLEFRQWRLRKYGSKLFSHRNWPDNNTKTIRLRIPTNYYVYCLSSKFHIRMFDDFNSDAILIIHNTSEFLNRFKRELDRQLQDYDISCGPIEYFDPYTASATDLTPQYSKHFRYYYQTEYRICGTPTNPIDGNIDPIYLSLGSLKDIAELHILNV